MLDLIDEIDRMGTYNNAAGHKKTAAGSSNANHPAYSPKPNYGRSVVNGINRGYFRRGIAEASYRFSEECEAGDRIIVGVNAYTDSSEGRPIEILSISHEVEVEQVKTLAAFKAKRDKAKVAAVLANSIRLACQGKAWSSRDNLPWSGTKEGSVGAKQHATNVMPTLVEGALCNCTLGEMVQAMADVYGRYRRAGVVVKTLARALGSKGNVPMHVELSLLRRRGESVADSSARCCVYVPPTVVLGLTLGLWAGRSPSRSP